MQRQKNIAVIGLGYVGLPIATAFAKYFPVVGFDVDKERVRGLRDGYDRTGELSSEELNALTQLTLSANLSDIAQCDFYIVTVPTPVDDSNQPDFSSLISASNTVGKYLKAGDIVVFESTVYPGATEEICVPVLESASSLKFNADFYVGYSPERINPGDKTRGLTDIVKVTSGSTPEAAKIIDDIYARVITAGTHLAPSLAVAEAAKVIENVQRDVNIALVNELATLFAELGLDTLEVLEAAGTKWNFLPFRPGLVGGHCIGVDPYYLIRKAQSVGHNPELIVASRRINNAMGAYVADRVIRLMMQNDVAVNNAKVLVLGLTFKENCPDLRNSRVIDVVREFAGLGMEVNVFDPWADSGQAASAYNITLTEQPENNTYDAIILTVAHEAFKTLGVDKIRKWGKETHVLFDTKGALPGNAADGRL